MKRNLTALLIISIMCFLPVSISAAPFYESYEGYNYNAWNEPVRYPNGYSPKMVLTGVDIGCGSFKGPADFFVDRAEEYLYVLDSGNGRIVVLDERMKFVRTVEEFLIGGEPTELKSPEGIFITDDQSFIIADTGNNRVLITDKEGNVEQILTKPDTSLLPEQYLFTPTKVIQHGSGVTYVLPRGIYQGAMTFDVKYEFMGFFGSSYVDATAEAVLNRLWRQFLTRAQGEKIARNIPIEIDNFDIDAEGFIYTVTTHGDYDQVKKLNLAGSNIMRVLGVPYGDMDFQADSRVGVDGRVALNDVEISKEGFYLALDAVRGRIYEYDQFSTIISIFGRKGNQAGTFASPVAVETMDENVLVLDSQKNSITLFEPTDFTRNIKKAIRLYNNGLYDEAVEYWNLTLEENSNCEWAYRGIGKALYEKGDYRQAMTFHKLGKSPAEYSQAFSEYRKEIVRRFFPLILILSITLMASVVFLMQKSAKRKKEPGVDKYIFDNKYLFPIHVIFHPIDGFEKVKTSGKGSITAANLILVFWFLSEVFKIQSTGFQFTNVGTNGFRSDQFNVIFIVISTIGIFFAWAVSNWAQTTLMDGKGKFNEIWIVCSYGLLPYVIGVYLRTILSQFMVLEEGAFIGYLDSFTLIWSILLIVLGLSVVHQFKIGKTIFSIAFSVIGVGIIVFLITLFYGLHNQLYMFFRGIYEELVLRF